MISLTHVTKLYGATKALNDVSLVIESNQTTILLGQSGCGKSTLLRTIIGLIQPDKGSIRIDRQTIDSKNIKQLRRRMGYVIQNGGLFPHLTAHENITLLADYLRLSKNEIDNRLEELRDLTHLPKDALDRYPCFLSGGQQQRVSLMRALMMDPEVLLLDEPLGALDPLIRADLQNDLREAFQKLNKTVVMVTHDLAEAAFLGHKIVLMHQGRILQQGTIHDLIHHPNDELITRFIKAQRNWNEYQ